jgi:hypothetical protein
VGKEEMYVIMKDSKEIGIVTANNPRELHKRLVGLLSDGYLREENIRIVRCS